IAGSLLIVVVCAALLLMYSAIRQVAADVSGSGLEWIRPASIALVFLIVGAWLLPAQYARRTTLASRGLIALSGLLATLLWTFIPWSPSFAVQQRLGPHQPAAVSFDIAYAPEIGRFHRPEGMLPPPRTQGQPANLVPLFLPLRIEGVA